VSSESSSNRIPNIEGNFEKLKRQMQESKKKASDVYNNANTDVNTSVSEDINVDVNKNTNTNINDDINVDVNKNVNIVENNDVCININDDVNKADNIGFCIEIKVEPKPALKRHTYYLKPETIMGIEKISKVTKKGVSEIVQEILERALSNVVIK